MPIQRKDPPASSNPELIRLDAAILRVLEEPARPVEVASKLNMPTHDIAIRLRQLRQRGVVSRIRPVAGPANGPGSSLYVRVATE